MDSKLKKLTNLCHSLFCERPHATEMLELSSRVEGTCYFVLEETLDSCWSCADHERMTKYALGLMSLLEIETADKALEFFEKVLDLCQQLNELISDHQQSAEVVRRLIG